MWAYRLTAPRNLELVDATAPTSGDIPDRHVLVRMHAGGICGSDIPKFDGRPPASSPRSAPPMPGAIGYPLHEIVGEVVASRHAAIPVGAHVVGWASRSDGLAEYVVTDGDRVAPYDPSLKPLQAVLIQSVACVVHALDRVDVAGQDVAVIGLGPIGLLFAHLARSRGARRVVGVDPVDRTNLADRVGLDAVVTTSSEQWMRTIADSDRPTVCIEAVGHQTHTLNHALRATADGGTILYFGIPDEPIYPVDVERLMRGHLTLIGGVTRDHRTALAAADAYVVRHSELYSALVTHVFDRTGVQDAFLVASTASQRRVKVLLDLD